MFHKQLKSKIQSKETVKSRVKTEQEAGRKVVFTNGCFDLLHPGHVDYLSQARDLGDFLVLGLNTDASVKKLNKAPNRPLNDENSRALVLAGLASVDAIVLFDEETPYELIRFLQPDVLVKGDDYKPEQIAGYDIVVAKGGQVKTVPFLKGYSTTAIVKKIQG
jgi:rfaE bifunctional protein nucleotidyltransferase chain/domain